MADAPRRDRRVETPLGSSIVRVLWEDLGKRDARLRLLLCAELLKVRSDKASNERSGDIVRVALDHESKVEEPAEREVEASNVGSEENTSDDGRSRGAEATAKGDVVGYLDEQIRREGGNLVRAENVECRPGDEVLERVEGDALGALTDICQRRLLRV